MLSTSLRAGVLASALCAVLGLPAVVQAAAPSAPTRSELPHLAMEGVPPQDPQLAARLARYQRSRQASFLDWLPDGGMLIATRFGDSTQVHKVAHAAGDREQLTFGSDSVVEARAQAGSPGFAFLAETADHSVQVYYWAGSPGSVRLLTPGKATHSGLVLAHDGRHVAFSGSERGIGRDVYIAELSGAATPRALTQNPGVWTPLDFSADDQKLLVLKTVSPVESYLYSLDSTTGAPTLLLPAGPRKASIRAARFAPDGRGLYALSDDGGELQQLVYFDVPTAKVRAVSPQLSWDVEDFDVSGDGRYIAYVVNEDGRSRLTVQDVTRRLDLAPADLAAGRISGIRFDRSGHRLALTLETGQQPGDVHVYDLSRAAVERWTHSEVGPIDPTALVQPELIHYPTWDRVGGRIRLLSAWLYRPRGPGPAPVLISIHGGPLDQFRPGWQPFIQFLVNELGMAVVAPNVRGSAGYGRSFAALDDGVLRQDAVRDIGTLLVWLGLQPGFDRQHIAVMGGEYGGYMALASLAAYSDRLCGGVDVLGIRSFVSYLGSEPPALREQDRLEYGDEREPRMRAFLEHISPLNNVAQIRAPLLIVQQATDPKGPPPEAQQMAWRLRSRGDEVWYVAAKDDGAWVRGGDAYLPTAALFLRRLLGGNVTATASP
jgi:dipeptidyl aminopeptidase/acylaminoacyl peptidase